MCIAAPPAPPPIPPPIDPLPPLQPPVDPALDDAVHVAVGGALGGAVQTRAFALAGALGVAVHTRAFAPGSRAPPLETAYPRASPRAAAVIAPLAVDRALNTPVAGTGCHGPIVRDVWTFVRTADLNAACMLPIWASCRPADDTM
jgi:hypothetical protein